MVVELNLIDFTELERKVKRNRQNYFLFCINNATGVVVQYPSLTNPQALGFNSRLLDTLTRGVDKKYNVIVNYVDKRKDNTWKMILPTNKPNALYEAIEETYGSHTDGSTEES